MTLEREALASLALGLMKLMAATMATLMATVIVGGLAVTLLPHLSGTLLFLVDGLCFAGMGVAVCRFAYPPGRPAVSPLFLLTLAVGSVAGAAVLAGVGTAIDECADGLRHTQGGLFFYHALINGALNAVLRSPGDGTAAGGSVLCLAACVTGIPAHRLLSVRPAQGDRSTDVLAALAVGLLWLTARVWVALLVSLLAPAAVTALFPHLNTAIVYGCLFPIAFFGTAYWTCRCSGGGCCEMPGRKS